MNALAEVIERSLTATWRVSTVPEVFRVGPSLIHRRTGRVESPRGERWLRRMELELLVHLYEHITRTFAREQLLQAVWRCRPGLVTRTVDQTVATLRQKIEFEPERPGFLQTVYGVGYRLVLETARPSPSAGNPAAAKQFSDFLSDFAGRRCVPVESLLQKNKSPPS